MVRSRVQGEKIDRPNQIPTSSGASLFGLPLRKDTEVLLALLIFLLALILFGVGFAIHVLWWIALAVIVLWLVGWVVGAAEGGGRRRWYGRS